MSSTLRTLRRGMERPGTRVGVGVLGAGAVGTAVSLLVASPAGAAAVATAPDVNNRETVQVELNPSGSVHIARLFSQLVVTGDGTVKIIDPTSTKDLRNLDGFAAPKVVGGDAVWTLDVHGKAVRRTVAEFDKRKLPVTVDVKYTLNGKPISAKSVVGKSGKLGVTYTIKNITSAPTEITYKDGYGKTITETVDVVTPFVGQLQTTLPEKFKNIAAPRADIAGDGKGGNLMAWTMVLFTPIGETTQTFGWTADVHNATIPEANVQVLPVPPQRKPELKFGQDGFQQGTATGAELTGGATQIDTNLVKLRDGASQLLDGLTQLAAGASALKDGLAGQAAPGATKLAGGADELKSGLGKLAPGAKKLSGGLSTASSGSQALASGSEDLAAGAGLVNGGAQQLVGGLTQVAGGLAQLSDASTGLPTALAGAKALQLGVQAMLAGIGDAATPNTILNGLAQVAGGLTTLADPVAGLPTGKAGVDSVLNGLDHPVGALGASDPGGAKQVLMTLQSLLGCPTSSTPAPCTAVTGGPVVNGVPTTVITQQSLYGLVAGLGDRATYNPASPTVLGGLTVVSSGLANAIIGVGQMQAGVTQITAGVTAVKLGLKSGSAASPGISEGLDALVVGLTKAVTGVANLNGGVSSQILPGAKTLAGGTTSLSTGAGKLADGAATLSDGLGQLDAGGKQVSDGLGQADTGAGLLADGAHQLDSGLKTAADGSGQLADGLNQAKSGGDQIVSGADQLHTQGTSELVKAGNDTTVEFGKEYAVMQALNAKAKDGALPYGVPAGATGSAAYSFVLAAESSASQSNTVRGGAAVALLVIASVGATLARRRLVSG